MEKINIELFDRQKHDFNRVVDILALSVGEPVQRVAGWCPEFYGDTNRELFVTQKAGIIVGVIGIERIGEDRKQAIIWHLAVHPDFQRQGLGRGLIDQIVQKFDLFKIEAETDRDAVEFYAICGFTISNLPEKFPGIERFQCVKKLK